MGAMGPMGLAEEPLASPGQIIRGKGFLSRIMVKAKAHQQSQLHLDQDHPGGGGY